MRKMLLLLLLLLMANAVTAQSISKQVIGSAGTSASQLSWTTGETIVGFMSAGGNQLGNGYYPSSDLITLKIEDNSLDLQIKIYPNPTSQMLYVSHSESNSFSIQITDLNGKQIYSGLINNENPLDVSHYTQGLYLVTIENNETNKKNTYKIIKK